MTDDLAAQMVREMRISPSWDMYAIARRYMEKALAAQAEEIERLRGEPTDAQIEAAARGICAALGRDPDLCIAGVKWEAGELGHVEAGERCWRRWWQEYRDAARAALKAAQQVKA